MSRASDIARGINELLQLHSEDQQALADVIADYFDPVDGELDDCDYSDDENGFGTGGKIIYSQQNNKYYIHNHNSKYYSINKHLSN